MRKVLVLLLAILMVFVLVACQPDPEDSEDSSALPVSKEESKQALIDQGSSSGKAINVDHSGFNLQITSKYNSETSIIAIGGKNDIFWIGVKEGEEEMEYTFAKETDGKAALYVAGVWIPLEISLKEELFSTYETLLYGAHEAQEYLQKGADEPYNGRTCATYSATIPMADKSTTSVKFYVDKEWGVTLGIDYAEKSESYSLSITPVFSNPELPSGYPAS